VLSQAFALAPDDSEILYELDQLLKRTGTPAAERLANLKQHAKLVAERDPLANEVAALHNQLGQYQEALDLLTARHFHPGRVGKVRRRTSMRRRTCLPGGRPLRPANLRKPSAISRQQVRSPNNVGLGWDQMLPDADIRLWYFTGLAREAVGDAPGRRPCSGRPAGAHFDLSPATFYQALALRKLGQEEAAQARLREMLEHAAAEAQKTDIGHPFFGTSIGDFVLLEEDLSKLNRITFTYMAGLAHLGLGHNAEAKKAFQEVLALDMNHLEAAEEARRLAAPPPLS